MAVEVAVFQRHCGRHRQGTAAEGVKSSPASASSMSASASSISSSRASSSATATLPAARSASWTGTFAAAEGLMAVQWLCRAVAPAARVSTAAAVSGSAALPPRALRARRLRRPAPCGSSGAMSSHVLARRGPKLLWRLLVCLIDRPPPIDLAGYWDQQYSAVHMAMSRWVVLRGERF